MALRQAPAARCVECGGPLREDPRHAELVCLSCGLVEPRTPAPEHDAPADHPTLAIPARRLPSRHGPTRASRTLQRARHLLNRLSDRLHAPPYVAQDALRRFQALRQAGATQGRPLEASVAACLLDALRDAGVPRTARQVAEAADVAPRQLSRAQRALADATRTRALPPRPVRYLWAYAEQAGIPPRAVAEAAALLQRARGSALSGRRPEPLAAAALVHACRREGLPHRLNALARAAGVSRQAVYDALDALAASSDMNRLAHA